MDCPLCNTSPENLLFQDDKLRVILIEEPDYPGFCRVIWRQHIREMTDLAPADQQHLFSWLLRTEFAVREALSPDKINLASLGNQVPHLHWHVIPRFHDDAHFPAPIWAPPSRTSTRPTPVRLARQLRNLLAGPGA